MKKSTNRFLLTIISLCIVPLSYGQFRNSGSTDVNGQTMTSAQLTNMQWSSALRKKVEDIKPAYLFKENYLLAELTLPNGKMVIAKNKFKLDLQESKLYFLDSANEEMEVVNPVKKVLFVEQDGNSTPVSFEKGFPPVDKLTENNFYQVVVSGKASLLLDTKFVEVNRIEYPSGAPVKRTDKLLTYYGSAGSTVKLAKTENILELLADKSKEISAYIQKENIKVQRQSDLEKVFTYYNSLFQ
ncbi:MAG: hypothetical protein ABI581_13180 [Sediminibacterium sp.]